MTVHWLEREELFPAAIRMLGHPMVVLDVGCGIMPQKYVCPLVHICCEPFGQYVDVLREKVAKECDRSYVILHATWAEAVRMFPPRSVDAVFLVDVIEHLEKEEAKALLRATVEMAREKVAVFTPLGFLPQHHPDGKDAWGLDGGEWQEHRSGWQPEDFGDAWEIYAARSFHDTDSQGRVFVAPYGAFWAIRNVTGEGRDDLPVSRREKIIRIHDVAMRTKSEEALGVSLALATAVRRVAKLLTGK